VIHASTLGRSRPSQETRAAASSPVPGVRQPTTNERLTSAAPAAAPRSKRQSARRAPAAASDPEALTGSDPAAPHFRFACRASKCSSAGLDIGPHCLVPRKRVAGLDAGARVQSTPLRERHAMHGTGYRSSRDHAASVWVDKRLLSI
jgi:hypothetical protein